MGTAGAHPLGNFTTNTAVRVVLGPEATLVRYVLDLAEIPTVQLRQRIDTDDDGLVGGSEADDFAADRCAEVAERLRVALDGRALDLVLEPTEVTFPVGQSALVTTRLVCDGKGPGISGAARLTVDDDNGLDRVGWREITILGDGVTVSDSTVPSASATRLLREYPDAALAAPSRVTDASATVVPGGPPAPAGALDAADSGASGSTADAAGEGLFERLTTRYNDLIARRQVTPGFVVLAIVLAVLLGAAHAVAPGHGKTVMAAYVVGERGTTRQALAIGGTVAMTHTVGTLLLGTALQASESLAAERLYPYFGLLSGALIVAIGVSVLRGAWRARRVHADALGAAHVHHHDEDGDAHDGAHRHARAGDAHADHDHHHPVAGPGTVIRHHGHVHVVPHADMGWRRLIALGVAGGLAPSPSALLVLLGAIALGRTALGIGLVVAYGLGLALVLVGGGLLLVRFRSWGERLLAHGTDRRGTWLTRWMPMAAGAAVVLGGIAVAARGFLLA